jgi:pilus assembly protein CpaB
MNTQRVVVLGLAVVAAAGAALMVRSMLGGGTPAVEAKPRPAIAMSEVLVADTNLQPGQPLKAEQVRWEKWPTSAVDSSFITHSNAGSEAEAIKGTVVRSPVLAGQPIANTAIVHADAAGFMAAMLTPGMRAISITISAESGAGGFVLPNDRVDVILTPKAYGNAPRVTSKTILSNVRVLAVDQTFKQNKDTQTVVGKTATIEVTPEQAELVSSAQSSGALNLALRPLGDTAEVATDEPGPRKVAADDSDGPVAVIRYGMTAPGNRAQQEKPQ